MTISIREANSTDFDSIWPILEPILRAGDTYAFPIDTNQQQAINLWLELPQKTYVLEENGQVLGSYFIKSNAFGPGDHVCNCGYIVDPQARGKGVATSMCLHSQDAARELGYRAMQFNSVVCTNQSAIRLWEKLGYDIVGRLPKAFRHPSEGYVDCLLMYKWLAK